MYDVVIIGGGAAGMMAAVAASRQQASVLILEHMDCCGKKILSTGNGRCNYTNRMQGIEYYRGDDPAFVLPALEQFGFQETIAFFQGIGIEPKDKNGYIYPRSMQAASIREAFLLELEKNNVKIQTNIGIRSIHSKKDFYEISAKNGNFLGKTCILATGGKSAKSTGSDGSGFLYLKDFSHTVSDLVPALTGMTVKESFGGKLAGIRTEAEITLFVENRQMARDCGEIQLTDYGISGIPVFQVSRFAAKALEMGQAVDAKINFLPEYSKAETDRLIRKRFVELKDRTAADTLLGLLNNKLGAVLLERAGILPDKKAGKCNEEEIIRLSRLIHEFPYKVVKMRKFDQSQVTAGGVCTAELDADTMESKFHPGLYFAGEIIDIDGMCGGYNLQWAWTSGYLAGEAAAKRAKNTLEYNKKK